jgi:hypothetical protein
MPVRRTSLALLVPLALVLLFPTIAEADTDFTGGPDENRDITSPGPDPGDTRPAQASTESADSGMTIFAAAVARVPIDDFVYDRLVLKGTAREVCVGRLLTGAGWTFNEIVDRFGGSAGTLYFCRERWDTATDPACNGQLANPVTSPNFYSTCWSNHARGRAIDVMVGTVGGGYNTSRGIAIINWLLARDAQGNVNANARKLGIQQILFNDRCWNSDGDRGIGSFTLMRQCGIGHHDHVHLDLTINGANGNVSYWGRAPLVRPKIDTQVLWDRNSFWRQAVSWWNMVPTDEEGISLPAGFDRAIVFDGDSNGVQDQIFLWDVNTGNWRLQNWTNGDSLNVRAGRMSVIWDEIIAGDWDGNGRVNDFIVWDRDTGRYSVQQWFNWLPRVRTRGTWSKVYDQVVAADLDGNGRLNDTIHWDQTTGNWVGSTWSGFRSVYRSRGVWSRVYDRLIVGDFSAGGDLDEMILWDRQTGLWVLVSWANFRTIYRHTGYFSTDISVVAPGDYDTDGRVDDLFLYAGSSGRWRVWSFHRLSRSQRLSGTWLNGYDVISVGSFMD